MKTGFKCNFGAKYLVFSPLVPSKQEKNILVLLSLYFFDGSVFTFQFLNDKIHNYVKKIYKLSKTNIFFSRFEGMRGEKTKYFAPKTEVKKRNYEQLGTKYALSEAKNFTIFQVQSIFIF